MSTFAGLPEQPYAARLLDAALVGPAHAYLLSGPAGSGKRRYADRFAAAILETELGRVERRTHPDLFVLEPEGQGILVEGARRLRRDLHLRPYEAARRVYLILDAHLLRDESANALLKSLEEPPEYGVFVLVSDHAGRMLPTILSRVQTVPFRRFSGAALEAVVSDPVAARAALGSLARAEWDELRLAVDTVGSWYRDLMAVGLGAGDTVVNSDVAGEMSPAAAGAAGHAARALEIVADVRRSLELNIHPGLGLEAMFHRLHQAR